MLEVGVSVVLDGDVVVGVLEVGVSVVLDGELVALPLVQPVSIRKTSKNIIFFNLAFVSLREISYFGEPYRALIREEQDLEGC